MQEYREMIKTGRPGFALALALLATGCTSATNGAQANAAGCTPGATHEISPAGLEQIELCIISAGKTRAFTVEVAATSPQQARGMMFRTELADNRGMLFPFSEPRVASFWMKNTVIPLDIIFIRSDGGIENIAENTIPYSTAPVGSTAPVTAVLELRGGLTGELGIAAGDKIRWK
jgi:uncharacterized membrane protein (UPF0127 family)